MTGRKKKDEPAKSSFDFVVDLITSRIKLITGLVSAIALLVLGVLNYWKDIKDKVRPARPCVEVKSLTVPPKIIYSDWKKNNMKITITGKNNCEAQLGLYLTYMRANDSESMFNLRVPYGDWEECKGVNKNLLQERICWETKKPLRQGKGDWEWEVTLPELEQVGARPIERIRLKFEVKDYDDPTKSYWSKPELIEVQNDAR